MLLIQSDLLKAVWYFTFPLVSFAQGPVPTSAAYCQVTGFFVALGTEASGKCLLRIKRHVYCIDWSSLDFAILMIAVHAAMYVFQSTAATTEAGLYNYRYVVYTCWIIYPVLMASLAFTNPMNPYLSSGTICNLPVRPFWYRLALSWIPRYIIIFAIIALYVAIYVYVHYKFKGIAGECNGSYKYSSKADSSKDKESKTSVKAVETNEGIAIPAIRTRRPTTPNTHGLLHESAPQGESEDNDDPWRQSPPSAAALAAWESYNFGGSQLVSPLPETGTTLGIPVPDRCISKTSTSTGTEAFRKPSHSTTESRTNGNYYIIKALRDSHIKSFARDYDDETNFTSKVHNPPGNAQPAIDAVDDLTAPLVRETQPVPVGASSLRRRHRDIKRKLRLLFIYPIVYVAMWLIPFVYHCLQYTERYSTNPPYPLTVLSVMVLALQGTVDGLLFSSREKPWRFVGNGSLLPWVKASQGCWLRRSCGGSNLEESGNIGEENHEEQGQMRLKDTWNTPIKGQGQDWWDVEGRMRMDSVMMGTDHNCEEHGGGPSQGPMPRRSRIEEEDEEPIPTNTHRDKWRNDSKTGSDRRGCGGLHRGRHSRHGSKGRHAGNRASCGSEGSHSVERVRQGSVGIRAVEQGRRASLELLTGGEQGRRGSLRLPKGIPGRRGSLGPSTGEQERRGSAVTFTEDTKSKT